MNKIKQIKISTLEVSMGGLSFRKSEFSEC